MTETIQSRLTSMPGSKSGRVTAFDQQRGLLSQVTNAVLDGRRAVLRADVAELQGPDDTVGDLVGEQQIQQTNGARADKSDWADRNTPLN